MSHSSITIEADAARKVLDELFHLRQENSHLRYQLDCAAHDAPVEHRDYCGVCLILSGKDVSEAVEKPARPWVLGVSRSQQAESDASLPF